ncbi:uncharacterized protein FA14DRAFT_183751, partial [Meira miltonrushii]
LILIALSLPASEVHTGESTREELRQSHPKYRKIEKQKESHLRNMAEAGAKSTRANNHYLEAHTSICAPFAASLYYDQQKYYDHKYNSHQKKATQAMTDLKQIEAVHGQRTQHPPMWKFSVKMMHVLLLILYCSMLMTNALPAKKTELESATKIAQKHENSANKYKAKSDNAYRKFQNSCLEYDKHNKKASMARIKVNDLNGIPRRTPTPIVEEVAKEESQHPHPQTTKTDAHHPSTSSQEILLAESSPPSPLSRTLSRGKTPVHASRH